LVLLPSSDKIIREGKRVQEEFLSDVTEGFSASESKTFQSFIDRMNANVLSSLNKL